MLNYTKFDLPGDGMTRIEDPDSYRADAMRKEGYTMVGAIECDSETKDGGKRLLGVFRQTESEAIKQALASSKKAEEERDKAVREKNDLDRQLKDATARIVHLSSRLDECEHPAPEEE